MEPSIEASARPNYKTHSMIWTPFVGEPGHTSKRLSSSLRHPRLNSGHLSHLAIANSRVLGKCSNALLLSAVSGFSV
jgi:hypothetical protein